MIQKLFAAKVVDVIKNNESVVGLAVGGSWLTDELDEFSDLDLVLITKEKVSDDKEKMVAFARQFGQLISAFTGEHVGEPRVLICLYDDPFLHVDIKFLILDELRNRVENPVVLFERDNALSEIMNVSKAEWPRRDHQWYEDRFWTWIHYVALKLGRGEYFEAIDFLGDLRIQVLAPLLLEINHKPPRGLRRVEIYLRPGDLKALESTIADYNPHRIKQATENAVALYRKIRKELFKSSIRLQTAVEERSMQYLGKINFDRDGPFRIKTNFF